MIRNWKSTLALSALAAGTILFTLVSRQAQATPPLPGDGVANAQFRRTVDPSERSATGNVTFHIKGNKEYCRVTIFGLGEEDFGIYTAPTTSFIEGNTVYGVAPLDRSNLKKGNWSRTVSGTNGAPLNFDFPISSLHDLEGGMILVGSVTQDDQLISITNVVNGFTNILVGLPLPSSPAGLVGCVLWAPVPPIVLDAKKDSFRGHTKMNLPPVPPHPHAKGVVKVRFDAVSGQSVLDIRTSGLERGQNYHVFVAESTNLPPVTLIDSGTMTGNRSGSSQHYVRDTAFGDPLPIQARDMGELSGRILVIRDLLGNIVLEATLP